MCSVRPMHGLVQASAQVVALRFMPTVPKAYESKIRAIFNNTPQCCRLPHRRLRLSAGPGHENNASLFFKPTCVGAASELIYKVTNLRAWPRHSSGISRPASRRSPIEPREG